MVDHVELHVQSRGDALADPDLTAESIGLGATLP
jgi:hypothetical protein